MIKEACVDSLEQAIQAEKNGADRIELCSRLDLDGLTPSDELVRAVCAQLQIPVMVMVRPRAGNFVYGPADKEAAVIIAKRLKAFPIAGIVIGALTPEGWPDTNFVTKLSEVAGKRDVTFHKAIDETPDPVKAIQLLSKTGITRVLTSGGGKTAREGAKIINLMQNSVDHIKVIAAGKITESNLIELSKLIHTDEFHGKKIVGDL